MAFVDRLAESRHLILENPGWGWCFRCHLPWNCCTHHCTNYDKNGGCFPLCQDCWLELKTPDARLPYYEAMILDWDLYCGATDADAAERNEKIRAAVLAGG